MPTILIVDNEESSRETFKLRLLEIDAEFIDAHICPTAVKINERNSSNLVFLGIRMLGMDGFQILEKIRKKNATKTIPVIVATNGKNVELRDRAFKLGADDIDTKPFIKEELIPRVKRFR